MKASKRTIAALAILGVGLLTTAASAATVVDVQLWDKGAKATMETNLQYGMPGMDMSKATMGIKAARAALKLDPNLQAARRLLEDLSRRQGKL